MEAGADREEIRGLWKFAAVVQFLHLFKEPLGIDDFETEELESWLVCRHTHRDLEALIVQLLKSLVGNPSSRLINDSTWRASLVKELTKRGIVSEENPMVDVDDMTLEQRVELLHDLCESQLDNAERFRASFQGQEEREWRVDPVGYDAKGAVYWLFDDNRLYKEVPEGTTARKKKGKGSKSASVSASNWSLVCGTKSEWEAFPARFERTRATVEKEFYSFLTNDALPQVIADLEEKEKKKQFEEAMVNRKRSSRLQMREFEKMEIEKVQEESRQRKQSLRQRKEQENRRETDLQQREQRMLAREQRIAQREAKLYSARNTPDSERSGAPKRSSRSKRKSEAIDDKTWYFDCICGLHGDNIDDGNPMIACEKCGVWQHIACLGNGSDLNQLENVDFICQQCQNNTSNKDSMSISSTSTPEVFNRPAFVFSTMTESIPVQSLIPPPDLHHGGDATMSSTSTPRVKSGTVFVPSTITKLMPAQSLVPPPALRHGGDATMSSTSKPEVLNGTAFAPSTLDGSIPVQSLAPPPNLHHGTDAAFAAMEQEMVDAPVVAAPPPAQSLVPPPDVHHGANATTFTSMEQEMVDAPVAAAPPPEAMCVVTASHQETAAAPPSEAMSVDTESHPVPILSAGEGSTAHLI
ncbi:hypothetical protein DFS34DRAFT_657786 [Phlyctochytrium arcticum]|nr:hypothetical protein DFS34DRAFT_657786 [Phlyctochytrium arcticum]